MKAILTLIIKSVVSGIIFYLICIGMVTLIMWEVPSLGVLGAWGRLSMVLTVVDLTTRLIRHRKKAFGQKVEEMFNQMDHIKRNKERSRMKDQIKEIRGDN